MKIDPKDYLGVPKTTEERCSMNQNLTLTIPEAIYLRDALIGLRKQNQDFLDATRHKYPNCQRPTEVAIEIYTDILNKIGE